jgi:hypothetical protein
MQEDPPIAEDVNKKSLSRFLALALDRLMDLEYGSATDATTAFVGDFSQLVIGVRTSEKGFEKLTLTFRVYIRTNK